MKGYTWDEASGGKSPSDAALGTGANWDQVATSDKHTAGVITIGDATKLATAAPLHGARLLPSRKRTEFQMEKVPANIWYLAGPMFQYNEDVKALARQAGLKIIDANMAVGRANAAEDMQEVTIKAEYTDQGAGERMPTAAELTAARADLLAAHDDLQQRERELAAEKERVAKQAHENELAATCNAEQAAANEAEAQRLRDEAVSLQAAKSAAATATVAAASAEKPAKAAKN